MNKPTFAAKLKETYEKSRVPLAYLLVLFAIALRFLPWPQFAVPALIALCLIILPILFETHKFVTNKESSRCSSSFTEAIPSIKRELDLYLHCTPNPSIVVLGIALYYQWPMLDSYLSHMLLNPNPPRVNVQIALLDPDWEEAERWSSAHRDQANSSISSIRSFVDQHKERIRKFDWSFEVWTFRYTPHWFGILIGKGKLFLGRSFWHNGRLRGGPNALEMLSSGDDFLGSCKIEEFRGWFEFSQQKKMDIGLNS
ncbi:MAG: hypothetical protein AB9866_20795 [Syntrophobacteraceae bacterium]